MNELSLIINEWRGALPGLALAENEPLSRHTSFRIGGPCAALIQPKSEEELLTVCRFLREKGVRPLVMGNGSNILAADGFIPRLVLQIGEGLARTEQRGETTIRAGSGILLGRLALYAASLGLSGLEFAHGMPGTLGGAVSMNAGAYGGEMKDVLRTARYLNGDLELCESGDLQLSYRHSRFSDTEDIILSADMELLPASEAAIRSTMKELMERREHLQAPCGRLCRRPHRRSRAQRLHHWRSAGQRKARGLCGKPGRRQLRGREAADGTHTKNRL